MDLFESVKCCSKSDDHIVEQPKYLECSHLVCDSCQRDTFKVFCSKCNDFKSIETDSNARDNLANAINLHLNDLSNILRDKFAHLLEEFKEKHVNIDESINGRFYFLKGEVDVLVDSLKNELDTLGDSLKNDLDEMRVKYFEYRQLTFDFNKKHTFYLNTLEQFTKDQSKSQQSLYSFQHELKSLGEMLKVSYKNDLIISLDDILELKSIGKLSIKNDVPYQMKTQKYDLIQIDEDLIGICNINNEYMIACDASTGRLFMYDRSFKKINTINDLNGCRIYAYYAVTNGTDRVYITSQCEHKLIMTDLKLNFIKYVEQDVIKRCYGIYYYKEHVYVCDYEGAKIVEFDEDLVTHVHHTLDIHPTQIQIYGETVCVRGWDKQSRTNNSLSFYDLSTFQLKVRYLALLGDVFAHETTLYHHNFHLNRFDLYNENGVKIDEISTDGFDKSIPDNGWRGICIFDGRLVHTTSNFSRKLIVI